MDIAIGAKMDIAITVMHASWSPGRTELLSKIIDRLGGLNKIKENTKYFEIVDDINHDGIVPNAIRAFQKAIDAGATHTFVLQDDMWPCINFFEVINHLITLAPNDAISLYGPCHYATSAAKRRGHSWHRTADATWGGTIILPTQLTQDFVNFNNKYILPEFRPDEDDARLRMFILLNKIRLIHTNPSLLEHVGDISTVGHPPGRKAAWFIGDDDPMKIDWTKGLESPVLIGPYYNNSLTGMRFCLNNEGKKLYGEFIRKEYMM